ncbi:hypothetical protein D3C75_660870 [compost metagenome]
MYSVPTITEIQVLNRPEPSTINIRPIKNRLLPIKAERAIDRCPRAIRIEPYQTAFCWPSQLSASQPPGSAARYMLPAKIPTMAEAFSRASPMPPSYTVAAINRIRSGRMP